MQTAENRYVDAWNNSYGRSENFLFVASDEVIRFVARYLRRRVDVNDVRDVCPGAGGSRVLDVGCGIGRNILFGSQMGLSMYGNDLSSAAVAKAVEWLSPQLGADIAGRIVASDIRAMPWEKAFFDHAMSDSVLDSMPFEVAQEGVAEVARLVRPGGYFYCSLISGDESGRPADFCGEVLVDGVHEKDTIQSYFDQTKIRRLLEPLFEILDCSLTQVHNPLKGTHHGRWHVVTRRR